MIHEADLVQALGQRVRDLRQDHGWTQQELLQRLADHGIRLANASQVSRLEQGVRGIGLPEAVALASVFEVSLDILAGLNPNPWLRIRNTVQAISADLSALLHDLEAATIDQQLGEDIAEHASSLRAAVGVADVALREGRCAMNKIVNLVARAEVPDRPSGAASSMPCLPGS